MTDPIRPPTPRLKTSGNKEIREDQEDWRKREQRKGEHVRFQEDTAISLSAHSRSSSLGTSIAKGVHPRGVQLDIFPLVALYLLLIALEGNQEKRN